MTVTALPPVPLSMLAPFQDPKLSDLVPRFLHYQAPTTITIDPKLTIVYDEPKESSVLTRMLRELDLYDSRHNARAQAEQQRLAIKRYMERSISMFDAMVAIDDPPPAPNPKLAQKRVTFADRLKAVVAKLTYKPGVRFEVATFNDGAEVKLTIAFDTADPNGGPFSGRFSRSWHAELFDLRKQQPDDAEILRMVREHVRAFEEHEMDEFLKIDGKHVRDPHPELRSPSVEEILASANARHRVGGCG